jgi:putative ABC transport system permease protein
MTGALQDLRYAVRTLAKSPVFTAVCILTLALGIGADTAIFSVVNSVLLRPLPFPDPDRMVMFMNTSPQGTGPGASATKFNVWREQSNAFQEVSAYRFGVMNLIGGSQPQQVQSGQVSADFFRLFGAPIARGRSFTADEDRPNGGKVVLLSDGFWKRQFGGDSQILGKTLALGGGAYEVIGVLGPSFDRYKFDPLPDVWVPLQLDPESVDQANYFIVAGRLKPGVTMGMANAQMQLAAEIVISTARQNFNMLLMSVFAGLALLLAAVGVYGLMAYSVEQRTQEIGIRLALGAKQSGVRGMIILQGARLALIGVLVGIAAAFGLARLIASFLFGVKAWDPMVFAVVPAILSAVAFFAAWLPALRASRINPIDALRYE